MNLGSSNIFINLAGERALPHSSPKPQWDRSRGDGYCSMRSSAHARRMGHLFTARMGVGGIVSRHCSWCWKRAE